VVSLPKLKLNGGGIKRVKTLLRYPGSKKRIAPWIIENMPEHHSYVEAFAGGLSVLLSKPPSNIETINDLDGDVVNLFRVIREDPGELAKAIEMTPYARQEYDEAFAEAEGDLERARVYLIRSLQSHGFRLTEKSGWKKDVQGRERAYAVKHWCELPDIILQVAERLKQVQIEHRPAIELIKRFNYPNVLIYADPPYVLSTRTRKQYKHEMSDAEHIELLEVLLQHKGAVMLSGYNSDLYRHYLSGWRKIEIAARAEHALPRVECLWMNY